MYASEADDNSNDDQRWSPATQTCVLGEKDPAVLPRMPWLSGPFVRLLATNMAFGFSISCFYLLPKHLTVRYAASPGLLGTVMGIFGLTCVVAVPWLGRAVNRLGLARAIFLSQALMAVSASGFVFLSKIGPAMLVLRALQGLATAGLMTAGMAMVCELAPAAKLGQAMGLAGAASLVMNALAPAVAEPIGARFGFVWVFALSALAASLGALAARGLPTGPARNESVPLVSLPSHARGVLAALVFAGVGFNVAMAFLAPLALARGVHAVRAFFIAYTASALAIRLFGSFLTDRLGLRRSAAVGMLVYGIFIAGIAAVRPGSLAPLGVGFGLAHGVLFPALMALLLADAEPAERAKLASFANGATNLGMLTMLAFGQLANHLGLAAVFLVTGALVGAAALLLWPAAREEPGVLRAWSQGPQAE
jgi:MFS family permease